MNHELKNTLCEMLKMTPTAVASVYGSKAYSEINGRVSFYPVWGGSLVAVEISGLPGSERKCNDRIFGFHIHEGGVCTGNETDPFADTKGHYNPQGCEHPYHAGDLPPIFGNHGFGMQIVYTDRFRPEDIIGKTVVVHDMPDDFKTQPSGGAGEKIACGEIEGSNQ